MTSSTPLPEQGGDSLQSMIIYEMPAISEYVWFGWGQDWLALYTARKVSRKLARYEKRLALNKWAIEKRLGGTHGTK